MRNESGTLAVVTLNSIADESLLTRTSLFKKQTNKQIHTYAHTYTDYLKITAV